MSDLIFYKAAIKLTSHIRVRACALIMENESVLLIEFQGGSEVPYNLPGGGAEAHETVREAAYREVKEEATL